MSLKEALDKIDEIVDSRSLGEEVRGVASIHARHALEEDEELDPEQVARDSISQATDPYL